MTRLMALVATIAALLAGPAAADSCWDHNGSLMRLQAQGENRWFSYEIPRDALRPAGVQRRTVLFSGTNRGDWYSGWASVFSSACPGEPLEYWVEGPVLQNPLRVVMDGTREVHRNCRWTGDYATDRLVFTYRSDC